MISKEELTKKYAELNSGELLKIIEQRHDYTDIAVSAALEELSKRKISDSEIKDIKESEIAKAAEFIEKNIVEGLGFFQKNLFYFVWLPILTFAFKRNYSEDGFVLKLKQVSYYSLFGFIFFMLAGMISVAFNLNDLQALAIWISGFLVASMFDEKMNRMRLVKKLDRILNQQEDKRQDIN